MNFRTTIFMKLGVPIENGAFSKHNYRDVLRSLSNIYDRAFLGQ